MKRFYVDGEIYTTLEYGKFISKKQFKESNGLTPNPKFLSLDELEMIGLDTLYERSLEDVDIYEIK